MYWLLRPPFLRWIAAGALLIGAAVLDLSEAQTTPFPFAATAITSGAAIDAGAVEWRDVPGGLLGEPASLDGHAAHDIEPGAPLVAGTIRTGTALPEGWWAVPVNLPLDVAVWSRVRLLASQPPVDVEGVITRASSESAFSVASPGMVAVPADMAPRVAEASRSGTLTVLVGT